MRAIDVFKLLPYSENQELKMRSKIHKDMKSGLVFLFLQLGIVIYDQSLFVLIFLGFSAFIVLFCDVALYSNLILERYAAKNNLPLKRRKYLEE